MTDWTLEQFLLDSGKVSEAALRGSTAENPQGDTDPAILAGLRRATAPPEPVPDNVSIADVLGDMQAPDKIATLPDDAQPTLRYEEFVPPAGDAQMNQMFGVEEPPVRLRAKDSQPPVPDTPDVETIFADTENLTLADYGFSQLTEEDIAEVETYAAQYNRIRWDWRTDAPILGIAFQASDFFSTMQSYARMQKGVATRDDEKLVAKFFAAGFAPKSDAEGIFQFAKSMATSAPEFMIGFGLTKLAKGGTVVAMGKWRGEILSEIIAGSRKKAQERYLARQAQVLAGQAPKMAARDVAKGIGWGAVTAANVAALRQYGPKTFGMELGAWDLVQARRLFPEWSDMTDEEAQTIVALGEQGILMLLDAKDTKFGPLNQGFVDEFIKAGAEQLGGPLTRVPGLSHIAALEAMVMRKIAGKLPKGEGIERLAEVMADSAAFNGATGETLEEIIGNIVAEGVVGDSFVEGLPSDMREVVHMYLGAALVGAGGASLKRAGGAFVAHLGKSKSQRDRETAEQVQAALRAMRPTPEWNSQILGQDVVLRDGDRRAVVEAYEEGEGIERRAQVILEDGTREWVPLAQVQLPSEEDLESWGLGGEAQGAPSIVDVMGAEQGAPAEPDMAGDAGAAAGEETGGEAVPPVAGGDASTPGEATAETAGVDPGVSPAEFQQNVAGTPVAVGQQVAYAPVSGQDVDVVAEGVEDTEIAERLRTMLAQGRAVGVVTQTLLGPDGEAMALVDFGGDIGLRLRLPTSQLLTKRAETAGVDPGVSSAPAPEFGDFDGPISTGQEVAVDGPAGRQVGVVTGTANVDGVPTATVRFGAGDAVQSVPIERLLTRPPVEEEAAPARQFRDAPGAAQAQPEAQAEGQPQAREPRNPGAVGDQEFAEFQRTREVTPQRAAYMARKLAAGESLSLRELTMYDAAAPQLEPMLDEIRRRSSAELVARLERAAPGTEVLEELSLPMDGLTVRFRRGEGGLEWEAYARDGSSVGIGTVQLDGQPRVEVVEVAPALEGYDLAPRILSHVAKPRAPRPTRTSYPMPRVTPAALNNAIDKLELFDVKVLTEPRTERQAESMQMGLLVGRPLVMLSGQGGNGRTGLIDADGTMYVHAETISPLGVAMHELGHTIKDTLSPEAFLGALERLDSIRPGIVARYRDAWLAQEAGEEPDVTEPVRYAGKADGTARWDNGPRQPGVISSSLPTAKKRAKDPLVRHLVVGMAGLVGKEGQKMLGQIAQFVRASPMVRQKDASDTRVLSAYTSAMVKNLLALHDAMPENVRAQARLWYDGAFRLAQDWGVQYGKSPEQVAAVVATLSPQKDWYMNVAMAERVLDTLRDQMGATFSPDMGAWGRVMPKPAKGRKAQPRLSEEDIAELKGTRLEALIEAERWDLAARFVRAHDEVANDPSYSVWHPDGRRLGPAMTKAGAPARVAWGSFGSIAKAVRSAVDGADAVISEALGDAHKVRSFYNNIRWPRGDWGDVTIDTHAVAAALFLPLSGASPEVEANLSGTGVGKSSILGATGLYPLIADAYRKAAAQRGLLPREMQSITWEAVRGLFTPGFKAQAKNVEEVRSIWSRYERGGLNYDAAREAITEAAGGLNLPDWFGSDDVGLPTAGTADGVGVRVPFRGPLRGDDARAAAPGGLRAADGGGAGSAPGEAGGLRDASGGPRVERFAGSRRAVPEYAAVEEAMQRLRSELLEDRMWVENAQRVADGTFLTMARDKFDTREFLRIVRDAPHAALIPEFSEDELLQRDRFRVRMGRRWEVAYAAQQLSRPDGAGGKESGWEIFAVVGDETKFTRYLQAPAVLLDAMEGLWGDFLAISVYDATGSLADQYAQFGFEEASRDADGARLLTPENLREAIKFWKESSGGLWSPIYDEFAQLTNPPPLVRMEVRLSHEQRQYARATFLGRSAPATTARLGDAWSPGADAALLAAEEAGGDAAGRLQAEAAEARRRIPGSSTGERLRLALAAAGALHPLRALFGNAPGFRTPTTEGFARWFAGSRIVDLLGRPVVLYHGTHRELTSFAAAMRGARDDGWYGSGFYLTSDTGSANWYAETSGIDAEGNEAPGAKIYPVYAALKNPFLLERKGERDEGFSAATYERLASLEGLRKAERLVLARQSTTRIMLNPKRFTRVLQANGYDGVVVSSSDVNGIAPGHRAFDEVVVFDPGHIKSAIGNRGTFDPKKRDIRYAGDGRGQDVDLASDEAFANIAEDLAALIAFAMTPEGRADMVTIATYEPGLFTKMLNGIRRMFGRFATDSVLGALERIQAATSTRPDKAGAELAVFLADFYRDTFGLDATPAADGAGSNETLLERLRREAARIGAPQVGSPGQKPPGSQASVVSRPAQPIPRVIVEDPDQPAVPVVGPNDDTGAAAGAALAPAGPGMAPAGPSATGRATGGPGAPPAPQTRQGVAVGAPFGGGWEGAVPRPDLNNPLQSPDTRQVVDEVDRLRNEQGLPAVRTRREANQLAKDELRRDYDGTRARIEDKFERGELIEEWETHAAAMILERLALDALAGREGALADALTFGNAYREQRSELSRRLSTVAMLGQSARERVFDMVTMATPSQRRRRARLMREINGIRRLVTPFRSPFAQQMQTRFQQEYARGERTRFAKRKHKKGFRFAPGLVDEFGKTVSQERLDALNAKLQKLDDMEEAGMQRAAEAVLRLGFDLDALTAEDLTDPNYGWKITKAITSARATLGDKLLEWRYMSMLSGPTTHVRNISGNAIMLPLDGLVLRAAEATANLVVQDPESATFGELAAWLRGFGAAIVPAFKNMANSYRTEGPAFEVDLQRRGVNMGVYGTEFGTRLEYLPGPKIQGFGARWLRHASLNTLLAMDEFFKTISATSEAWSLAYRQASREKLKGKEREQRAMALLGDMESDIWTQSLYKARAVTFQDEGGAGSKATLGVLNSLIAALDDLGDATVRIPIGSLIIPFRRTPVRIAARSVRLTPLQSTMIPFRAFHGEYKGKKHLLVRDLADALLAYGLSMTVLHMLDDEDDDGLPFITGPRDANYAMSTLDWQTAPPMSIRAFGTYWSYASLEPFSTSMGLLVAAGEQFKREGSDEALQALLSAAAEQTEDKTFLRTIGDVLSLFDRRNQKPDKLLGFLRDTIVTPMIPNLLRQPLRESDDVLRQRREIKDGVGAFWLDGIVPTGGDPLAVLTGAAPRAERYDAWGQVITKPHARRGGSDTILRLLNPVRPMHEIAKTAPLDMALRKFNDKVERGELPDATVWYPVAPPDEIEIDGTKYDMTDEEYRMVTRDAGRIAAEALLADPGLNLEDPGPDDIREISRALKNARDEQRDKIREERRALAYSSR